MSETLIDEAIDPVEARRMPPRVQPGSVREQGTSFRGSSVTTETTDIAILRPVATVFYDGQWLLLHGPGEALRRRAAPRRVRLADAPGSLAGPAPSDCIGPSPRRSIRLDAGSAAHRVAALWGGRCCLPGPTDLVGASSVMARPRPIGDGNAAGRLWLGRSASRLRRRCVRRHRCDAAHSPRLDAPAACLGAPVLDIDAGTGAGHRRPPSALGVDVDDRLCPVLRIQSADLEPSSEGVGSTLAIAGVSVRVGRHGR